MNAGGVTCSPRETLQDALLSKAPMLREAIKKRIPPRLRAVISPDDILQEVGIGVVGSAAPGLDDVEHFDAWLLTIAERRLLDAIKLVTRLKRGGHGGVLRLANPMITMKSFIGLFELAAAKTITPSSEVAVSEAVTAVRIALAAIPDSSRRALWLCYIEGRSREQIATIMGRSPCAVNALLFRGLQLLKHYLGPARRFFSDAPSSDGADSC